MSLERVVVISDASVTEGGTTALALLSVRQFRARGLPVTYICGDSGDAPHLTNAGVEVVALGDAALLAKGPVNAALQGIFHGKARDMLAAWIAQNDTAGTIYHVHGWAQILSPSIFAALRPVCSRVVVHSHDQFLACPNGVYMDFRRQVACTRAPLGFDCLTTNCDKRSMAQKGWRVTRQMMLRKWFDQGRNWGPIVMIHPGMSPSLERGGLPASRLVCVRNPASAYASERIRAEDNRAIVFVGRVQREKGIGVLAEAAKRADMPLTVVGQGPMSAELEARYPENTYAGWCDPADIGDIVKTARVMVMPSLHPEPFGLVAAEASASGLPVILPDTALMSGEIVENGLGLSYGAQDPAGLATQLEAIRDMPRDEIQAMSERAFAQTYPLAATPEQWGANLIALYEKTLEQRAN